MSATVQWLVVTMMRGGESGLMRSRRCVLTSKLSIMCIAMNTSWIWSCSRPLLTSQYCQFSFQAYAVLPLFYLVTKTHQHRLLKEGCQELQPQDGTSTAGSSTLCTRTLMSSCSVLNPSGHWVHLTAPQWGRHLASWGCCRMRTSRFFCSCFISSCLMLTCCTSSCRRRTLIQFSSSLPSRASQAVCRQ